MSDASLHGLDAFAALIRVALAEALGVEVNTIQLERPKNEEHGEFALPCFRFANSVGNNPAQLASALADSLDVNNVSASAVGPFLNFQIDRTALARKVLGDAGAPGYGRADDNELSIIEYSSPNIAKPMHVGHLRSTVIGAAMARLFDHLGHEVVRINHLGDWGSQFGKLLAAWKRWGKEVELETDPIGHLLKIYVEYHNQEECDPSLDAEAKASFLALESGENNEERRLWVRFTELSLAEFQKIYDRLGASFDLLRGESWYEDKLDAMVEWLERKGVVEDSDGAQIVDLTSEGIKTPCLIKTSHGTTLYATRDLAAAKSRWDEFHFARCLYFVGSEQKLHFDQFKAALKRCGTDWWDKLEHVPFGLVRFPEGKLSTRAGRVLRLSEVLDRAVELAREIVEEKNPDHPDKDTVAEQVGVGAVIFHDLSHARNKEVVFDWKEVLSFEGDTGPSVQYTHARCCSILRRAARAAPNPNEVDSALLADAPELWIAIGRFPGSVREAAEKREPMILAHQLLRIASAGNVFYREKRVLGTGNEKLEGARLAAVDALRRTLSLGLGLLGVPAPTEM
ncbi:MAG: arginine--tRNA ligase [Planctomycetes bacterium]|nr:arginine--tRNA ligase [Planctomycetota bacterium]